MGAEAPEGPEAAQSKAGESGRDAPVRLWRRFHVRLSLLYGAAILLVLTGVGAVDYRDRVSSELHSVRLRLLAGAVGFAAGVDESRLDDPQYGAVIAQRLAAVADQIPDVQSAYVLHWRGDPSRMTFVGDYSSNVSAQPFGAEYDASGVPMLIRGLDQPVAEDVPVQDACGVTLSGYAPIRAMDGSRGAVIGLDVLASRIEALDKEVLLATLIAFGSAIFLLVPVAAVAGRMLRGPLWRVISATTAIERGELAARVRFQRGDEFGVLGRHFDRMADGLEEREFLRSTFGRYVSADVARKLLTDRDGGRLGGEERVVTVLFSDIAGYSTVAERLEPAEVVAMLNEYVGAMNTVIAAHRGCVIEFFGDGILAVFGAPEPLDRHEEAGVSCARAMRDEMVALNERWRLSGRAARWLSVGHGPLTARIGVHTGPVIAGNMGSELRMKYAVIGDAVNVASRLEAMNKLLHTSILVSDATRQRLTPALADTLVPRGSQLVKGRQSPVEVFEA